MYKDTSLEDDRDGDLSTQFTASDSITCKYSACSLGYYSDPCLDELFKKNILRPSDPSHRRKAPIINRGYYARVKSIDIIINKFLNITNDNIYSEITLPPPQCKIDDNNDSSINPPLSPSNMKNKRQIINLGCGFDTLSMRLISEAHENLDIFEVDFEEVVDKKALVCLSDTIKTVLTSNLSSSSSPSSSSIISTLSPISEGKESSISISRNVSPTAKVRALPYKVSGGYKIGKLNLLSVDLRNADDLLSVLVEAGLKLDVPTLILSECVLVYIEKKDADKLCSSLGSALKDAMWVTYDMINPYDAFGKVMATNLRSAGYKVPGFTDFHDLNLQMKRFIDCESWGLATSIKMLDAYEKLISKEDKQRISKLEIFDEIEEWSLLMSHYCLTIASKGRKLSEVHSLLT